jgi:hypothetical protein
VRDMPKDAARGIHTLTREELALAGVDDLGVADEAPRTIQRWRRAAVKRWAILALEKADRFQKPENRAAARLECMMWIRAIESGQVDPSEHPLVWPYPIGSIGIDGPPTREQLAEVRAALHGVPKILGGSHRYDPPFRAEELAQLRSEMPPLYLEMEAYVRMDASQTSPRPA